MNQDVINLFLIVFTNATSIDHGQSPFINLSIVNLPQISSQEKIHILKGNTILVSTLSDLWYNFTQTPAILFPKWSVLFFLHFQRVNKIQKLGHLFYLPIFQGSSKLNLPIAISTRKFATIAFLDHKMFFNTCSPDMQTYRMYMTIGIH